MARAKKSQFVHCYFCGHLIDAGPRTMSTVCPGCNRKVLVEDVVVKGYTGVVNLETCGKLIVLRRGHAAAQNRIVALAGIEVKGRLHCIHAFTAGRTTIGSKAEWRGDLQALSLVVEPGAVIEGGRFKIPEDPLAEYRHLEGDTGAEMEAVG